MSQFSKNIDIRSLDKSKLVQLLAHGDRERIALRTPFSYEYVRRIIAKKQEHDTIWAAVVNYLDSRPTTEVSLRTLKAIGHEEAA